MKEHHKNKTVMQPKLNRQNFDVFCCYIIYYTKFPKLNMSIPFIVSYRARFIPARPLTDPTFIFYYLDYVFSAVPPYGLGADGRVFWVKREEPLVDY